MAGQVPKCADDRVVAPVRTAQEQWPTKGRTYALLTRADARSEKRDSDRSVSSRQTFDSFRRKLAFDKFAAVQAAVGVGVEESAVAVEQVINFATTALAVAVPACGIVLGCGLVATASTAYFRHC
jgi:hypothetical protein